MITPDAFKEIVKMYEKHGWVLRRVLLSDKTRFEAFWLGDDVLKVASDIDAAWFSRPPMPGRISWEIRSLGPTPFALVESINEASPDFESDLDTVKHRMIEALSQRKQLDN